jgi:hypothetical protein
MEVPPGLNSFRRLLTYRIGQRFGLDRGMSNSYTDNGEKGILLFKTATTQVPKTLLIDLAKSRSPEPDMGSTTSTKEPAKKILVMKRRSDVSNTGSGKYAGAKSQVTAEEREKAYLEARARIFGDEVGDTGEVGEVLEPRSPPSPSPAPVAKSTSTTSFTTEEEVVQPSRGANKSLSSRVVDAGSWKEKRGQTRDVEAEKADPDFVRRNASARMATSGYSACYAGSDPYYPGQLPLAPGIDDGLYYPSEYSQAGLNPHANTWSSYPPQAPHHLAYGHQQHQQHQQAGYYYPQVGRSAGQRSGQQLGGHPGGYPSQSDFPPLS